MLAFLYSQSWSLGERVLSHANDIKLVKPRRSFRLLPSFSMCTFHQLRYQNRRESFADIGEVPVAAMGSEEGKLTDYVNFRRVGQGRFSSVFYAETKVRLVNSMLRDGV